MSPFTVNPRAKSCHLLCYRQLSHRHARQLQYLDVKASITIRPGRARAKFILAPARTRGIYRFPASFAGKNRPRILYYNAPAVYHPAAAPEFMNGLCKYPDSRGARARTRAANSFSFAADARARRLLYDYRSGHNEDFPGFFPLEAAKSFSFRDARARGVFIARASAVLMDCGYSGELYRRRGDLFSWTLDVTLGREICW